MYSFKTSSSTEVTTLIKKHGTTDALLIKNLSYFTNLPLAEVDEPGVRTMKTGVRYIIQGLGDNTGLVGSEFVVLTFWANQLSTAKEPFLISHAQTLIKARANGPFSKYDLKFIRFVASTVNSEAVKASRNIPELLRKDSEIMDLAYESSTPEGLARLMSGRKQPGAESTSTTDGPPACANHLKPISELPRPGDVNTTNPDLVETLPEIETAIMRIREERREFTFCMMHSDDQLQRLRQKRKFLRTKVLEAQNESDDKGEYSFLD
ncbi:hypothetical protein FSARC_10203 [Fusarium sarcochroum]|uniref:Uncharacterized protein n=1 Tax=Fusarium sarcochroum TaxID=1208366 RepID=A0A8H4TNY9_9HYPO|nr:hypothetical protein FSARC_10203 [Fusarium sarcochroum]